MLTPKIQKAINLAAALHYKQKRKGDGLPYIVHPYSVAFILSEYTNNENIIIAGLLHDVLEDASEYSYSDMKRDFGAKIAEIVKEVSVIGNSDIDQQQSWQERKNEYLNKLKMPATKL